MSHENYKKTLGGSKLSIFEKIEHDIQESIKTTKNELAAIELLAYCPKKDGTPKANFSLNFGLVAPWGESYKVKNWNGTVENRRFAEAWFGHDYSGKRNEIKFRFRPYHDDNKGTDPRPETNFQYFEGNVYFGTRDFDEWAGFDTRKEPERMDAPFVFRAIKEYYAGLRSGYLEIYERELKELPKWFDKAIKMAVKMRELVDATEGLSHVHSFIYRNFTAYDTYSLQR